MSRFEGSWLKIQRAQQYIAETELAVRDFVMTDFYGARIENDHGANFLCVDIDKSHFPFAKTALAIGDCVHNLRTALDHLWCQVVLGCGGKVRRWTNFPVFDTGEELASKLNAALKDKQITVRIARLMLDVIKPYQGGNDRLWSLHNLDIRDKHEMLIPVLELMQFSDVRLEDEETGVPVGPSLFIMDETSRIRVRDADYRRVKLKDKGHATATVLFDEGTSFWGEPVVVALHWVSEEVTRTVKAFEVVLP
jgi:hypothetical protein